MPGEQDPGGRRDGPADDHQLRVEQRTQRADHPGHPLLEPVQDVQGNCIAVVGGGKNHLRGHRSGGATGKGPQGRFCAAGQRLCRPLPGQDRDALGAADALHHVQIGHLTGASAGCRAAAGRIP